MTALLAAIIGLVSVNLSMFNPVEQAFENFHMTDVYYEMSRSEDIELNNDIVMVDMVELRDRGEIGQVIQQISACKPRVMAVDLLFYREGDDALGNAMLVSSIDEAEAPIVFSSKLVDYDKEKDSFGTLITSFFAPIGDYQFAYGNVKTRPSIRWPISRHASIPVSNPTNRRLTIASLSLAIQTSLSSVTRKLTNIQIC